MPEAVCDSRMSGVERNVLDRLFNLTRYMLQKLNFDRLPDGRSHVSRAPIPNSLTGGLVHYYHSILNIIFFTFTRTTLHNTIRRLRNSDRYRRTFATRYSQARNSIQMSVTRIIHGSATVFHLRQRTT